ncbi:uncharacterized protein TERG_12625 [Trichophyton rubrum CBS 118892]|uniref:Uncharacterized protein n=1 Tax=Trichophyton rubrum (strain ATCC MYA-4607 / CBS 118892) TaxID=559305 RepID=A0A080WY31_TRIRC|nr:uncharacterized protein TERG_12625 [Trichophyton rubrum CBS 118892]KFL62923.1 hypothetical protein TERG_12625 [Trichophyton rubrum CBS 118892]
MGLAWASELLASLVDSAMPLLRFSFLRLETVVHSFSLLRELSILICSSSDGRSLVHGFLSPPACVGVGCAGAGSKVSSNGMADGGLVDVPLLEVLPLVVGVRLDLDAHAFADDGDTVDFACCLSYSRAVCIWFSTIARLAFSACLTISFFSSRLRRA